MITKDELIMLRDNVDKATQEYRKRAQAYAQQECPYKVGDEVTVLSRAHHGKTMKVTSVRLNHVSLDRVPGWLITGTVLKTDGSPSAYQARRTQEQHDYLYNECGGDINKFREELEL